MVISLVATVTIVGLICSRLPAYMCSGIVHWSKSARVAVSVMTTKDVPSTACAKVSQGLVFASPTRLHEQQQRQDETDVDQPPRCFTRPSTSFSGRPSAVVIGIGGLVARVAKLESPQAASSARQSSTRQPTRAMAPGCG